MIDINTTDAGRDLDRLIHIFVLGKSVKSWNSSSIEETSYSTNLLCAWEIVDAFHKQKISLVIKPYPLQPFYRVGILPAGWIDEYDYATAETPSLAICRAGWLGKDLL